MNDWRSGTLGVALAMAMGCSGPMEAADTGGDDAALPRDTGIDARAADSGVDAPASDTGIDAPADDTGADAPADDTGVDAPVDDAGHDAAPTDAGPPPDPRIVSTGTSGMILRGTVVTPTGPIEGEVLVMGDTITCVAASCASATGASTATIVETEGVIAPGLIDMDTHVLFRVFDESDWTPMMAAYTNHNQWTNEARYGAMVDAKQYLNGEGGSPLDLGCDLDKYGELMGLMQGATSIVTSANPANRACYGSLARTIDQTPNGLPADKIQVATLFPATAAADGVCGNYTTGRTDAYLIHIAEGVDMTARNEFATLNTISTMDGCLYAPETTLVHGTALGEPELSVVAAHGMGIVWTPRYDVWLYGAGTDLTRTLNVPLARSHGISISLATDFFVGNRGMLDVMRYADEVDDTVWGDTITSTDLVTMATANAAAQLGLGATIGGIAVGLKADLLVVAGDRTHPYDAIVHAAPGDVRLVVVGGVALYGDTVLQPLAAMPTTCEAIDACGTSKFVCVATTSTTSTDRFGETLSDITTTLDSALTAYDAMDLSAWDFSPRAPLFVCP